MFKTLAHSSSPLIIILLKPLLSFSFFNIQTDHISLSSYLILMPHPPPSFLLHIFLANQPFWSSILILMPLHPASSNIYDHASSSSVITIRSTPHPSPYYAASSSSLILLSYLQTLSSNIIQKPHLSASFNHLFIPPHPLAFS